MSKSITPGPADRIRQHLAGVQFLRTGAREAGSADAVLTVKRLQAIRFEHTYHDFLGADEYALAARFFLEELYGIRDFSTRDQQFSRIAGGLERLFPAAVAELAVDLTELHVLTERLDHDMAVAWLQQPRTAGHASRYVAAWRATGSRTERERQLALVARMGAELEQLTRKRSLRTALRFMRGPARAAGLDALQGFLETGFDAFASMTRPAVLMTAIQDRESEWLDRLFTDPDGSCQDLLQRIWGCAFQPTEDHTDSNR